MHLAVPTCIFRGGKIWSPRHRNQQLHQLFHPHHQAPVQPILPFIPQHNQLKHLGSGETETGKPHPSLGLVDLEAGGKTPCFSPSATGSKNTPDTGGLSLLFTSLSCSPAFLEIAGKPSSTRLSCTLLSRVSGGGGAAAGGRAAEPAAFPPRVHANGACTARAASRGWPVLRRPRCPLSRMPAGR